MVIRTTPDLKIERMVVMKFGADFFKILNLVIQIMRLFAKVFGDEEDKKEVAQSERRSENDNLDEAC